MLFDLALARPAWHVAQHPSFLVSALLFWTAMAPRPNVRARNGGRALAGVKRGTKRDQTSAFEISLRARRFVKPFDPNAKDRLRSKLQRVMLGFAGSIEACGL